MAIDLPVIMRSRLAQTSDHIHVLAKWRGRRRDMRISGSVLVACGSLRQAVAAKWARHKGGILFNPIRKASV